MTLLSRPIDDPDDPLCLTLADVSRANFYARSVREVYIQLPPEDPRSGERDVCGRLLRTMYGTLDAAERWADHYGRILMSQGFERGAASPCHFHHPGWGVSLMVHGDDFIIVAKRVGRERTLKLLEDQFELKHDTIGPIANSPKELRVLGRIITWHDWGWTLEADPSLIEAAVEKMGLEGAKGVAAPGYKVEGSNGTCDIRARRTDPRPVHDPDSEWPGFDDSEPLTGEGLKRYQSVSALLNFISMDRPEEMYAVKELMRRMSNPTTGDESKLKRVVRFLRTLPRLVARYPWSPLAGHLEIYTDSDHAGCPLTRRSTLGGCVMWGGQVSKGVVQDNGGAGIELR